MATVFGPACGVSCKSIDRALAQRPDLMQRIAQLRAAGAEIKSAKTAYLPTLRLEGSGGIGKSYQLQDQLPGLFWGGYFSRFMLCGLLVGIVVKIILLIRESREKSRENEQLKSAYLEAELELLKGQLNPHFLFNSLSSLSGIIRENPAMAQHYVGQLSKVFRYSLERSGNSLVSVADELNMIKAYGQLLVMRFEKAFELDIAVDDTYLEAKIPHLSLQLLLENAAKHNMATLKKPLIVKVYRSGGCLVVSNNLQPLTLPESSTGIGLANLNQRFNILMGREIEITKTANEFLVKLPVTV